MPFELLGPDKPILYRQTGFKTVRFCLRARRRFGFKAERTRSTWAF